MYTDIWFIYSETFRLLLNLFLCFHQVFMASHKKWEKKEEISSKQNKNNVKTHKYLVALFTNKVFTITLNFLKFLLSIYVETSQKRFPLKTLNESKVLNRISLYLKNFLVSHQLNIDWKSSAFNSFNPCLRSIKAKSLKH